MEPGIIYKYSSKPIPKSKDKHSLNVEFRLVESYNSKVRSFKVRVKPNTVLADIRAEIEPKNRIYYDYNYEFSFLRRSKRIPKEKEQDIKAIDLLPKLPKGRPGKQFRFPNVQYRMVRINAGGNSYVH